MKKSTPWIILTLVLVFAAGVVGGVLGERFARRPQMRRPANAAERYPSHDRWAKDLGLSAEQQEKIREIFKKIPVQAIPYFGCLCYRHLG